MPTDPLTDLTLRQAADGFSGSEIEEVVVSGLYGAFSRGETVTTEALLAEISRTRPLSVTMAEHIEGLREWARDRAVRAN